MYFDVCGVYSSKVSVQFLIHRSNKYRFDTIRIRKQNIMTYDIIAQQMSMSVKVLQFFGNVSIK